MDTATLLEVVKLLLVAEVLAIAALSAVVLRVRRERRERNHRYQAEAGLRGLVRVYLADEQAAATRAAAGLAAWPPRGQSRDAAHPQR